jgi:hypothetical protein
MEGPHSFAHIAFFASGVKPPNTDELFVFEPGQRILKMSAETPCAQGCEGDRNSVTATTDSDPGAIQGPGQESGNADRLAASGGAVPVAGHGGRRAIGDLQGWWPREASASHTCRGLALLYGRTTTVQAKHGAGEARARRGTGQGEPNGALARSSRTTRARALAWLLMGC